MANNGRMRKRKDKKQDSILHFSPDLAKFFDLLAKFDYEDRQKEKSVIDTDPLESAPKGSVLLSESK